MAKKVAPELSASNGKLLAKPVEFVISEESL